METLVTIDELWLTFLVATVLPMITALFKQQFAASWWGSLILLALSVVSGWLTSLYATGGVFELRATLIAVMISFITAVGFHFGLLKPAGLTGDSGVIQRAVPVGLGSNQRGPDPA